MNTLTIYRNSAPSVTVDIDEKTIFSQKLMTEHLITSDFYSKSVLDITIGDYITHNTENYYVNRLPGVTKVNNALYSYHIEFESVMYNLSKKLFLSSEGLAEYAYVGTASDFVTNIVANINDIDPGWTVGTVDTTTEQLLNFTNESCRAALTKVAEAFKLEFEITGKSISLTASAGSNTILSFTYGKNQGLYKLERQQVSNQNIVTKVYGFGGIKNIPDTYRDRARRLVFEERYLTENTGTYGVIEGQFTDDTIFPQRTGTLTAVNILFVSGAFDNVNSYIEDNSIDFDINSYLIAGSVATIVFKSGDLAGQEFEIWKYDHANHRMYINPYSDEDGYTTPNTTNVPVTGDTYTLINISMPQEYIDTAETALKAATQTFLDENCIPQVIYTVDFDPKYAKSNAISLKAGDRVTIVDTALGVNNLIRVSGIEYPLTNVYKIKAVIADFVPYTLDERIISTVINQKRETVFVDRTTSELERRNAMRQNQLKSLIFDTDGYFDAARINPLSIETMFLSVGAKSGDFKLNGVTIQPNYLGDANRLFISPGQLIHNQISIGGVYVWNIGSAFDQASLTPTTAYYLYAKCSKSALTGEWVLTASQITVEQVAGYYHFLCGILYAVADGWRDFDFTYGMTYINGRIITTGRIRSVSGLNYFDLDQNQFRIGDSNSSLDWNVTAANTLTLKGALVQNPAAVTAPIPCFRGAYNATYTYYLGDEVTSGGSTWMWVNATSGSGHTPAESAYWTLLAAAGTGQNGTQGPAGANGMDGNFVEYRYAKNSSSTVAPALVTSDVAPSGWTTTPPATTVLEYLWTTTAKKNYAGTALVTPWSTPVRIKGDSGANGVTGPTGASPIGNYRGIYNASTNYYGTTHRVDIVSYLGLYYIARIDAGNPFSGQTPTNTTYWNPFGANFESIATSLLFAELAYIDNLGVKYFRGNPVGSGNLAGSVVATQANITGNPRIDYIALSGTTGSATITVSGLSKIINYVGDLTGSAIDFIDNYYSDYEAYGVAVTHSGSTLIFTEINGTDFTGNSAITNIDGLTGTVTLHQAHTTSQKRIDTVTLTGTGGMVNILCDGTTKRAVFSNSLTETAANFVTQNSGAYQLGGVVLTSSGANIIFTSLYAGLNFTGSTTITNVPATYIGAVNIEGNDIWENETDADNYAQVLINMKGYNGGFTRFRGTTLGDGKGNGVFSVGGNSSASNGIIVSMADIVYLYNLPTSAAGLATGRVWRDSNGFLKIVY